VGIIGGSGLYQMPELTEIEKSQFRLLSEIRQTSSSSGTLENERVAFLPRHATGHRLTPTEGTVSREHLRDESYSASSEFYRRQRRIVAGEIRAARHGDSRSVFRVARAGECASRRFFGEGIVAHVSFAHPVCSALGDVLETACGAADVKVHRGGTYLCMEGPAFSTVAESNVLSLVGHGHHRHDKPTGSKARAGG
jgi:5'-methylthioadenosine phosphorylase